MTFRRDIQLGVGAVTFARELETRAALATLRAAATDTHRVLCNLDAEPCDIERVRDRLARAIRDSEGII